MVATRLVRIGLLVLGLGVLTCCAGATVVQTAERASCPSDGARIEPKWLHVAYFDAQQERGRATGAHIVELLNSHGIRCLIAGSVAMGVFVPEADGQRAIAILKQDSDAWTCEHIEVNDEPLDLWKRK